MTNSNLFDPLHQEPCGYLIQCAITTPSADNAQPWRFRLRENGFDVLYDANRVGSVSFQPDAPATLLSIGALTENIRQGAEGAGLDVRIDIWPEGRRSSQVYARVSVPKDSPAIRFDKGLKPALFERHTNRAAYDAERVIQRNTLKGVESARRNAARLVWFRDDKIRELGKLICRASEVRFQTRQVHDWLMQSLRFTPQEVSQCDGLDLATLALPLGGKALLRFIYPWQRMQLLNRAGFYKLMAAIDAQPIAKAPLALAIVSPSDADSLIDAGALLEYVWIDLNMRGLAVHPYYVISDQLHRLRSGEIDQKLKIKVQDLAEDVKALVGTNPEEQVQMIFRIGYTKIEPVRSLRLRQDRLISGN